MTEAVAGIIVAGIMAIQGVLVAFITRRVKKSAEASTTQGAETQKAVADLSGKMDSLNREVGEVKAHLASHDRAFEDVNTATNDIRNHMLSKAWLR